MPDMKRFFKSRRLRAKWVSASSALLLLFAQLSVAAYACPAFSTLAGAATVAEQSVKPCADMDPQQTSLCKEHCKGQSAIDKVKLPISSPAVPGALTSAVVIRYFATPAPIAPFNPTRIAAAPLSIRFCVLRI
jgi:hypothetical protein